MDTHNHANDPQLCVVYCRSSSFFLLPEAKETYTQGTATGNPAFTVNSTSFVSISSSNVQ